MKKPFDFVLGGAATQEADREEELRMREAEISRRELRAQVIEALTREQLPVELADLVDYSDAERAADSLEKLTQSFRLAVQKAVETRVAAGAPRVGAGGQNTATLRQAIARYYRL